MFAQISFTADKKLKKMAMEKAKSKGITLKSLLVFSMEAFINEKINLGLTGDFVRPELKELDNNEVNANLLKEAEKAKRTKKSELINL